MEGPDTVVGGTWPDVPAPLADPEIEAMAAASLRPFSLVDSLSEGKGGVGEETFLPPSSLR